MAKGSGGTRSGNSSNPRGVGSTGRTYAQVRADMAKIHNSYGADQVTRKFGGELAQLEHEEFNYREHRQALAQSSLGYYTADHIMENERSDIKVGPSDTLNTGHVTIKKTGGYADIPVGFQVSWPKGAKPPKGYDSVMNENAAGFQTIYRYDNLTKANIENVRRGIRNIIMNHKWN